MALPLPSQTPRGVQRARHALDGDSLREAPKRDEGMFIIILFISIIADITVIIVNTIFIYVAGRGDDHHIPVTKRLQ